jgi:hypothetical protein
VAVDVWTMLLNMLVKNVGGQGCPRALALMDESMRIVGGLRNEGNWWLDLVGDYFVLLIRMMFVGLEGEAEMVAEVVLALESLAGHEFEDPFEQACQFPQVDRTRDIYIQSALFKGELRRLI